MRRRPTLLLTALLTVLLTACSGGAADTASPSPEASTPTPSGTTETGAPATTSAPATTPASAPTSATPSATTTDGALTIAAWDLTFTLPETIPPADVTLQDQTSDGIVNLLSATLEDALADSCGGSSVEHGEFAQVVRRDDASADDEGNVAVGGHVYHVAVFTDLATCYPDDLAQRYLTEDVGVAIRESLAVS